VFGCRRKEKPPGLFGSEGFGGSEYEADAVT